MGKCSENIIRYWKFEEVAVWVNLGNDEYELHN